MNVAVARPIETGDHALRVDMEGDGKIGSRRVDCSKLTLAQQKTVKSATAVNIGPHDVASRVDSIRDGKNGSWHINLGKLRRLGQVTSCFHRR